MQKLQADSRTFSFLFLNSFFLLVLGFCYNLTAQVSYNTDPSVLKDPTGYKLRSNDRIRIVVRGEPDCTVEEVITNEGIINLLYVGDIYILGLNKKEATDLIEQEYKSNLIFARPQVNVSIIKYSERVVFLTGSVNRKGPYVFPPEVEAMNIVEVIARAGGFSDIARKNRVYVTRTFFDQNGIPQNTQTYEVDVEALSSGGFKSKKNFWIYPGDRIEVPERLI